MHSRSDHASAEASRGCGAAPAAARVLLSVLALLMLHWGATSADPYSFGAPGIGHTGVMAPEHTPPLALAAPARSLAAKPRHPETNHPPTADNDRDALVAAAAQCRSTAAPPAVAWIVDVRGAPTVRSFDARAPPGWA